MNVERIELCNFGSWAEADLPIEPGVTLISGPNGAGKSTLLSAIEFGLYGATSDAGRLIRRGTDRASVSLVVDTEEGRLHVTRTIQRSGASAKVSLSLGHEVPIGEVGQLTAATATETQTILDGLLGVSREVLLASAFSSQHSGAAFTEAAPRDRKRLLGEVLSLGMWEQLAGRARGDLQDAKYRAQIAQALVEQHDGAEARIAGVAKALGGARADLVLAEQAEDAAQAEAERLAAEAEAAREARRMHDGAITAAAQARADHDRATAERTAADEALARARAAAANAPSIEDAFVAVERVRRVLQQAEATYEAEMYAFNQHGAQLLDARQVLADLGAEHETGTCIRCGQELSDSSIPTRLAEASMIVERLEREAPVIADTEALEQLRRASQKAREQLSEAQTIQALAGSIDAAEERARAATVQASYTLGNIGLMDKAVQDWTPHTDSDDAEAAHMAALDAATHARLAHLQAAADLATAEAAAQQAEREANAEADARAQHVAALAEAAVAEILAAGFGPNGVPALVIDNILGQLADESNRVLAELGTPIRVDLRSQRVTQAGKIVDALDIIVLDGVDEAPYETLSGGERTRVALALRAALTRLLAAKSGAQVRLLVIDEPSGLDAQGAEAFADVLQAFIQARIFDTAIVVTHDERLADRIDRVIRITKTPGGKSRLAENSTEPPATQFPSGGSAEQLQEADHA